MIILDTNVISALMLLRPDPHVTEWLDKQSRPSLWITSVTVFEIEFGLRLMPPGAKRSMMTREFEGVLSDIDRRIAAFDEESATRAGDLMASRQKQGRPVELRDTMIAGIVLAHHATLATRNVSHFADISAKVVNPWKD